MLVAALLLVPQSALSDTLSKGEYLFKLANCLSCHTDFDNDGQALAGGRLMDTEFGSFYTPNITPDKETGIGNWSDDDFVTAMQQGLSPSGEHYYPSFPYTAYAQLSRDDILAIKAYIFEQPAVKQQNKDHDLAWYLSRLSVSIWKLGHTPINPKEEKTPELQRGSYVINSLGHCGECHTPRLATGQLDLSQHMKGNDDLEAPDISAAVLKDWSEDELIELFDEGVLPDGDYLGGKMAEVIEYSTTHWTEKDRDAAIKYLLARP